MRVEIHIVLSSEMGIKHSLKKLTNYTESDIWTQRLLLLPGDWEVNDLFFTKRLQMKNNFFSCSYSKHFEKYWDL